MANRYTEEDKQRIRETYLETGQNAKATARQLGIPRSTVRGVALGLGMSTTMVTDEDAALWGHAARTVAQRIAEVAPQSEDLGQLAQAARAATAAHLDYRDGRKGTSTTINNSGQTVILIE